MALESLATRRFKSELMDQPFLDVSEHARALIGLGRLNSLSGACRGIWREIAARASVAPGQPLRILDVASGGGDIAFGIWKLARRARVDVRIEGLDISPAACELASKLCQKAGRTISFHCADVTTSILPAGFDVAMSSLFLHHLSRDDAIALLVKMCAAGRLLIASDLRRSAVGYAVARMACRLVTRSRIVHNDGPQSVANAFTLAEMREICTAAGLSGAVVRRAWPWRLLVIRDGSLSDHAPD